MKQIARLRIATPYTTQRVYSVVTYRWPDGRGYASFGSAAWPAELLASGGVLLAAEGA